MNEYQLLQQRIEVLEFHHKLLVRLIHNQHLQFYKLIIEKGLTEQEVNAFYSLCDKLSEKLEEQKAEGYVYFHPLFVELSTSLPSTLKMEEVVKSCLQQKLYQPLFQEIKNYL